MGRRIFLATCGLTAAALIGAAANTLPATSSAAPGSPHPTHRPTHGGGALVELIPPTPVIGERPMVRGVTPGPAKREVMLQTRRRDGTWRNLDRQTSGRQHRFSFVLDHVTSLREREYRVHAPAIPGARGWWSGSLHSAPVTSLAVHLTLPVEARTAEPVIVTARVSPPRPGEAVRFVGPIGSQVRVADQDERGVASVEIAAPAAGETTYVATAPGRAHRAAATSDPRTLRTVSAVAGVPRIDIVTDDGEAITSKTTYKRATLTIDPLGSGVPAFSDSVRLRVRGNYTSQIVEKLPYKLKLDDPVELAGYPASEDWVLLANFLDRSLLRTTVAMEASRRIGLPWSPRFLDAEVWLNGAYQGLYQLGEGIEAEPGRVETALDEEETAPEGGGWLLEADEYDDDDPRFITARGLQVFVKEPGVDEAYAAGVATWVQEMEDVLYSPGFADPETGYAAYLDVDSFVDWYLVMELTKNLDSGFKNSIHMLRPVGGRLAMGPPWDFDLSMGNSRRYGTAGPLGWYVRTNWAGTPHAGASQMQGADGHWLSRLFEDPAFRRAVRVRWLEVRPSLRTLPAFVTGRAELIQAAAERNFAPVESGGAGHPLGQSPYDNPNITVYQDSHAAAVAYLRDWLATRMDWFDDRLLPSG